MSLPVIRSLGKNQIHVITAEREETKSEAALGFYSKYSKETMRYPAPDKDERGFIDALCARAVNCDNKPVILPVGMDSLLALSKNKIIISSHASIAVAELSKINLANDKESVIALAQTLNIPCPDTVRLKENESVSTFAEKLKYPTVIKHTAGELLGLDPQSRYSIVYNSREFAARYSEMHEISPFPLVQEYVPGDGYGVSVVFDLNHNPISVFCHKRIREYPVSGGPSCCCVSIWNDELVEYSLKLLRALDWVGVAMVEFKGSPETGFKLMEINPRFWGSLALTVAAGCDILFSLYRAALGETSSSEISAPNYKLNKKMRFILQDLLSFSGYIKIKSNKPKFIWEFTRDLLNPTIRDGVLSLSDINSSRMYLKSALRKRDRIIR